MAITTRYFGVTANGAGDGTTWNDRAALFTGGAWSTVITGFNFAGSDSLLCLIGPGTHTITAALSVTPTVGNRLFLHGCNSSGVALTPPSPQWTSNSPEWDESGLPVIATTTNIIAVSGSFVVLRLLKFTATGRTGAVMSTLDTADWCVVENSISNASAAAALAGKWYNSIFRCTGSVYSYIAGPSVGFNCLAKGVTGSSGQRAGFAGSGLILDSCTAYNCGGSAFLSTASGTNITNYLIKCTLANCGGDGVTMHDVASQVSVQSVVNCVITGNAGFGINMQTGNGAITAINNRLRDNTSGNFGAFGNDPVDMSNETTDSDDSTEYNNAGAGDFRIKASAAILGHGYGVSDMPPATGYRQSSIMNTPGVWSL